MNQFIKCEKRDNITIVTIDRALARNAVNPEMADALYEAFLAFENDDSQNVAILTGVQGAFCAGFDLKAAAKGMDEAWYQRQDPNNCDDGEIDHLRPGPMGPTRLRLSKPVICAIGGPAVAGGMELALWCDLRVVEKSAYMGVYCRRFGVPLIDGGAIRLPRLIGQSRAMDLILTGRKVDARECFDIGLANRLCEDGQALETALELARTIAKFPQGCMRADKMMAIDQWTLEDSELLIAEWKSINAFQNEGLKGAGRFSSGKGRSGDFEDF